MPGPVTFANENEAVTFLKQVAAMSVKAGEAESNGAGWGYIGILNGHVVKLATHFNERHKNWADETYIKDAGKDLKESIREAATKLLGKAAADRILKDNGCGDNEVQLIKRSVALKLVREIAVNKDSNVSLSNVVGSRTVKKSSVFDTRMELWDLNKLKNDVIDFLHKRLEQLLPGYTNKFRRDAIEKRAQRAIVVRDGELTALVAGIQRIPKTDRNYNDVVTSLMDERDDGKFRMALDVLLCDVLDTDSKGAAFEQAVERATTFRIRKSDPLPKMQAPSLSELADDDGRTKAQFLNFKARAVLFPPTVENDGKKTYHDYISWTLDVALEQTREQPGREKMTLADLTLDDFIAFLDANRELSPQNKGFDFSAHPGSNGTREKTISTVFELGLAQGIQGCKDKFLGFLNGLGKKVKGSGVQAGGLALVHSETFKANGTEVVSVVEPKRTRSADKQLLNLSMTSLCEPDKTDKPLFKGLRFGSRFPSVSSNPLKDSRDYYGQLIEQSVLNGEKPKRGELKLYRIDMSEDDNMQIPGHEYKLEETVYKPEVCHLRLQTDSALPMQSEDGTKKYVLLKGVDIDRNEEAILDMLYEAKMSAKMSGNARAEALAQNLYHMWSDIRNHHCKGEGESRFLELYVNYGADMMRLGAKAALLAFELEHLPSFNCKGGRDRTGLMDVECKTLALWLKGAKPKGDGLEHADQPSLESLLKKYDENDDSVVQLRATMREKSGNQQIAREILLNDQDMLMNQVKNLAQNNQNNQTKNQEEDEDDDDSDFPRVIRSKDGWENVRWDVKTDGAGLKTLYPKEKEDPGTNAENLLRALKLDNSFSCLSRIAQGYQGEDVVDAIEGTEYADFVSGVSPEHVQNFQEYCQSVRDLEKDIEKKVYGMPLSKDVDRASLETVSKMLSRLKEIAEVVNAQAGDNGPKVNMSVFD